MRPRIEVIATMRVWLLARPACGGDSGAIGEDTDIIEMRALDSLDLVEFILFLEAQSGRPILVETLEPAQLRTLATIYTTFFEERP